MPTDAALLASTIGCTALMPNQIASTEASELSWMLHDWAL